MDLCKPEVAEAGSKKKDTGTYGQRSYRERGRIKVNFSPQIFKRKFTRFTSWLVIPSFLRRR